MALRIPIIGMALLLTMALSCQAGPSQGKSVEPLNQWSGSVNDLSLLEGMPEYITSAQEFKSLWQAWKVSGPLPRVDFSREFIVIVTTRGSRLRLTTTLENANLKIIDLATRDLRPGFRYVIALFSRKGVKTVNGKQIVGQEEPRFKANTPEDLADFGLPDAEVQSVNSLDTVKLNAEVRQAAGEGETWPKDAVLVALKFLGPGFKDNTRIIEARTPPEGQDTATIIITQSGYPDDAIGGEKWRLWLEMKTDGIWIINRALWAQLCNRPGHRFYSAEKCP